MQFLQCPTSPECGHDRTQCHAAAISHAMANVEIPDDSGRSYTTEELRIRLGFVVAAPAESDAPETLADSPTDQS
ncbi:hypothetical protein [Nonomuraea sp. SYSU D8015]|uniref:hypothetical protein n=1 Tax=Nonomuraea sp. SYSU D8015 TaxID=2593644 RepID=UPI00166025C9|nr:hypothetical protein [Nonomuraea sp. SYSU D8015]